MFNGGPEAYRPEKYGERIIFERQINATSAASFSIKNEDGVELHAGLTATEEKGLIFEHFGIDINNPLILLQQEEAKRFFKENDPTSLYEYFVRGSQLNAVQTTSKSTNAQLDLYKNSINADKTKLQRKKAQLERLEKYYGSVEEKRTDLEGRMAWGRITRDLKPKLAKKQKEIEDLTKIVESFSLAITDKERELDAAKRTEQKLSHDMAMLKDEIEEHNKQEAESKSYREKLAKEVEDLDKAVKQLWHDKGNVSEVIRYCEREIREAAMNKANNNKGNETEIDKILKEIELLTAKEEQLKLKIIELGDKRELVLNETKACDDREAKVNKDINRLERQRGSREADIKAAKNARKDDLAAFGRPMVEFVNAIEQNQDKFTKKPIGPIGRHIKIKPELCKHKDAALLIHAYLSIGLLRSFIVANTKDRQLFWEIANKYFVHGPTPEVFMMQKNV